MLVHCFDAFVDLVSMSNKLDSNSREILFLQWFHVTKIHVTSIGKLSGISAHIDAAKPFFNWVDIVEIGVIGITGGKGKKQMS